MQVQPGMAQCHIPYLGHFDLLFTFLSTSKEKYCLGHILNTVLCMITKLGMVPFIIVPFIYVAYQQTPITVQYKIDLKCKDILYPTLHSLQNQTFVGHVMYLTGTLAVFGLLMHDIKHSLINLG